MQRLLLLFVLALTACGSTEAPMGYTPTVAVRPAEAARPVAIGRVSNERGTGREDPTWIGTIRGGYGNPVRALNADRPIDQVVSQAFAAGLAARGLQAGAGAQPRHVLNVTVHEFNANQYVRREATADFSAVLVDRSTGREAGDSAARPR